ncbi:MAG: DEAD/DEAH box helicase [Proteobacteria bacterium]|nr:DEAD/DEAH box helicase [Pseudomonadota bacterium]
MNDFLVFDLETQRSAQEVGGWDNIAEMKVSVGVIWDSVANKFSVYFEDQVMDLIAHLLSGPTVIGYNHIGFDYTVLSGYYTAGIQRTQILEKLNGTDNLDLLVELKKTIGKRVKLDAVARATLKVGKSADGLMALKWYKEYIQGEKEKIQMIADYCTKDVEVTRDVYLYGIRNGNVYYEDKETGIKRVEVDWGETKKEDMPQESVQLSF